MAASQQSLQVHGTKFALLSDHMYQLLKDAKQEKSLTESSEMTHAKKLDDSVQDILQDRTLSQNDRAKMYSNIASDFLQARSSVKKHPLDPIVPEDPVIQHQPAIQPKLNDPQAMQRQRIERILLSLRGQERHLDWTPTNTILVNGKEVEGTDIEELMKYVTLTRPPVNKKPHGLTSFLRALNKSNVPAKLVPNKKLQQEVAVVGRGRKIENVIKQWVLL